MGRCIHMPPRNASQLHKAKHNKASLASSFGKFTSFQLWGQGLSGGELPYSSEPKLAAKNLPSLCVGKLATKTMELSGSHIKSYSYSNPVEKQTLLTYYPRTRMKSQLLKFIQLLTIMTCIASTFRYVKMQHQQYPPLFFWNGKEKLLW